MKNRFNHTQTPIFTAVLFLSHLKLVKDIKTRAVVIITKYPKKL